MGGRDGAVLRALASHQCGLGSIPRPGIICGLSLLLVLSLTLRVFLGFSSIPPSTKTNTPNSNLIRNQWMYSHSVDVPLPIPIYFILYKIGHSLLLTVLAFWSRLLNWDIHSPGLIFVMMRSVLVNCLSKMKSAEKKSNLLAFSATSTINKLDHSPFLFLLRISVSLPSTFLLILLSEENEITVSKAGPKFAWHWGTGSCFTAIIGMSHNTTSHRGIAWRDTIEPLSRSSCNMTSHRGFRRRDTNKPLSRSSSNTIPHKDMAWCDTNKPLSWWSHNTTPYKDIAWRDTNTLRQQTEHNVQPTIISHLPLCLSHPVCFVNLIFVSLIPDILFWFSQAHFVNSAKQEKKKSIEIYCRFSIQLPVFLISIFSTWV